MNNAHEGANMQNTLADLLKPFDIRTAPIWAIPQLRWLANRKNFTVLKFRRVDGVDDGWVVVYIENEGYFHGVLRKSRMNKPGAIPLTWGYRRTWDGDW